MNLLAVLPLGLVLLAGATAHAEDVTGCGQYVHTNGVLTADLDCTGEPGCGIVLADDATLSLGGYTLTVDSDCGISCDRDCSIDGVGGSVVASGLFGIFSDAKNGRMDVSNMNTVGARYAIYGARVQVMDSSISDAGVGATGLRSLEIHDSEFTGNGDGALSQRHLTLTNSTFSGNARGALAWRKIEASGVTATDNGHVGLSGKTIHAADSTVTGNGGAPECTTNSYGCVDLISRSSPKLSLVACETSGRLDGDLNPTGDTWGVCSGD